MRVNKKNLVSVFGVAAQDAGAFIRAWNKALEAPSYDQVASMIDDLMEVASKLIGGYSTEAIRGKYVDSYWQDSVAVYVNMGETYASTLLYDTVKDILSITSVGDFVERHDRAYEIM